MGFDISYIVDILKFPWPLFPKYKYTYPMGLRFDIPALRKDYYFDISLPVGNKFELQSFTFSSTGYKDGDSFTLKKNNEYIFHKIYTKELGQVLNIRPVKKIDSTTDKVTFIFSNNTGTSKVIWVDLDMTVQRVVTTVDVPNPGDYGDTLVSPLAYFFALSGQMGYADPASISTSYWKPGLVVNTVSIPVNFWEGRNALLGAYGNFDSIISSLSNYNIYLYKLVKDTLSGFTTPLLTSCPWTQFQTNAGKTWETGGLDLSGFTNRQLAEMYLSHALRVPVNIFDSASIFVDGNRIDYIKQYLKPELMFVFDWIDFNDVESDSNIGAFAYDPAGNSVDPLVYDPLKTIKSYINIEPQSLNLNSDYSRVAHPREYYFPDGATTWQDAHYHSMDGEQDPLSAYDLSTVDPTINTVEVFNHEIGHAIDLYQRDKTGLLFSQQVDWLSIAGWPLDYFTTYENTTGPLCEVLNYKSLSSGTTEPPVSAYGASHPMDDFAETYAMYCCNPRLLKEQYPKRWSFMETYIKVLEP